MQTLSELRQGMEELWGSVAGGWRHLRERMSGALTRFKRHGSEGDNLASSNWALLAGDVYEDDRKIVVRLEVPGLEKDDFHIQVSGDTLIVSGEKCFEAEASEGRYRVLQCAYGSFQRAIALPGPVIVENARASYKRGVLKIELPKAETVRPRTIEVKIW
ncbi:MAG: Hsp20/alpha crystallin family protein [Gammaproteobacteria bacterium]